MLTNFIKFALAMTLKEQILQIPAPSCNFFTVRDIFEYLSSIDRKESRAVVYNAISALVREGRIDRVTYGVYTKNLKNRRSFFCVPDESIVSLSIQLKSKFPFVDICIWDIKELIPLMHHIPSVKLIIVEVSRDVLQSVSDVLSKLTDVLVMGDPSESDIQNYALGREAIVVKPLVCQAPLIMSGKVFMPRIEKLLVDILCDAPFYYLRGSETDYVFRNAFEGFRVNKKCLVRYASRRKKAEAVVELLERLEL